MKEQAVDALAYPVLRRRPATIGEPQRGTNCQLSAGTGLPAISLPAGFTDDDLPIGVELLGSAWSEPALLSLAYSYEQKVHPRRPPITTPPLVDGKAPAPRTATGVLTGSRGGAAGHFTLRDDVVRGRLSYAFEVNPASPIVSAVIRRGATGPIVCVLLTPADAAQTGEASIAAAAQIAMTEGHAVVELRTDRGDTMAGEIKFAR